MSNFAEELAVLVDKYGMDGAIILTVTTGDKSNLSVMLKTLFPKDKITSAAVFLRDMNIYIGEQLKAINARKQELNS